jgi:Right handed beta helix region
VKAGLPTSHQPPTPRPRFRADGSAKRRILMRGSLVVLLLTSVPTVTWAKAFHCTDGDVNCLIAAINHANASQRARTTITLGPGNYTLTAVNNVTEGENGLPVIDSRMTIKGTDAETTIIERSPSAPAFRILYVTAQGSLKIQGVTMRGGLLSTLSVFDTLMGGGILSHGPLTVIESIITENTLDALNATGGGIFSDATLTIDRSIITRNRSGQGLDGRCGGVAAGGPMTTVTGSTVSNNVAGFAGGGLCNFFGGGARIADSVITSNEGGIPPEPGGGGIFNGGALIIINTTIATNALGGIVTSIGSSSRILSSTIVGNVLGGGIFIFGGGVTLQNTIVALNFFDTNTEPRDCTGPITSLGNNLIGDPTGCMITLQGTDLTGDPGLGAFTDDGTPDNGHFPLLATSRAIDAGNDAACPKRDQLGEKRRRPCDIGSIEFPHKSR